MNLKNREKALQHSPPDTKDPEYKLKLHYCKLIPRTPLLFFMTFSPPSMTLKNLSFYHVSLDIIQNTEKFFLYERERRQEKSSLEGEIPA